MDILSPKGGLNLVTTAILYLAGSTVLLMFVSVYLSYVLPTEYGVRKSPFFPLIGKREEGSRGQIHQLYCNFCKSKP